MVVIALIRRVTAVSITFIAITFPKRYTRELKQRDDDAENNA